MTQAKFLWPHITNLYRDTYEYSSDATAAFAPLHFRYGGLGTLQQGPGLFCGGSYTNTAIHFTHDDITAAGDADINELLYVIPTNPGGLVDYVRMCLRVPNTWVSQSHLPDNCIYAQLTGDNDIEIRRVTGVSTTTLLAEKLDLPDYADGWPLIVRFRAHGMAIKLKVWSVFVPEPAAWNIEITNFAMALTGIPYCCRINAGTGSGYFSHVAFGLGESAPDLYGTIAGNVFEAPDTGVARLVRAVSRTDPMVAFEGMSEADGSYAIQALLDHSYSVYAIDSTLNAGIKDRITPVVPSI